MGAPVGNKNATKNRPWAEALSRVNTQSDGAKMRALAEKVWDMALAGDVPSIKEIAERSDGKAAQAMTIANEEGESFRVDSIVRKIVRAND